VTKNSEDTAMYSLNENDIEVMRKMCGVVAQTDLEGLQAALDTVTSRADPNSFYIPMSAYARCALVETVGSNYTTDALETITRVTYPTFARFVRDVSIDEYRSVVFGRRDGSASWPAYIMGSIVLLGSLVDASDDEAWKRLEKSVAAVVAAMD